MGRVILEGKVNNRDGTTTTNNNSNNSSHLKSRQNTHKNTNKEEKTHKKPTISPKQQHTYTQKAKPFCREV